VSKPNAYKKFVQRQLNRSDRRLAKVTLQVNPDAVSTRNPPRQVAWLAS
jgi:hypothetical protein